MVLPIYLYGEPILREETVEVERDSEETQRLIDDMIETMQNAPGVGLAAPQIGRSERIFVVDLSSLEEELKKEGIEIPPQPMAFINPEIVWESETAVEYEEGCLSIPDLREPVIRPETVRLRYLDRGFTAREMEVTDYMARVIQHEYDHLEGVLFIDRLRPLKRRLLRRRLREIASGQVEADYPVSVKQA